MRLTQGRRKLSVGFISAMAVVVAVGVLVFAPAAGAQDQTGGSILKDCPPAPVNDPYTIGDTVSCTATFINEGAFAGTVTLLTETVPFITSGNPGNGVPSEISCTLPDTTVVHVGEMLPANTPCIATLNVTIPDDPALCNTVFRDRVEIGLEYPQFSPPLEAGGFATHTLLVVCPPQITVTKVADELSKVGDSVDYTIEVCNTGLIPVNKTSVIDSLIGDISAPFAATLAPGACSSNGFDRTVLGSDPDPVVNTVTATYTGGIGAMIATAFAQDDTNLFQPGVDVTKDCGPAQVQVGEDEICTIHVTNTSSADSPNLSQGTITDTLTGDLLDPTNPAVTTSDCTAVLATGADCTIMTHRAVLASDPSPLVNSVTVLYHPVGFPNDITDTTTASVEIVPVEFTVTKTASELSKVGDDVTYTMEICNTGPVSVNRTSVIDSLLGDISGSFDATLVPGTCSSATLTRTVVAGDPDPLVNTVTFVYSGIGESATAAATASTNLFQPGVDVTKSCSPDPVTVGAVETCVIGISNTSSADSPNLASGTIIDTLNGDLLAAGNPAVASSDCTTTLAVGASCTITTTRTVLASDPNPLVNTVTVLYHPVDFPNDITDSATASVAVIPPPPVGACHETVNPAGQPGSNTSNGFPDDPFGGHAVPGGKSTSPGTNGNGPINSDGFYLVSGNLFSDTTPIAFPGGGNVWPENTTVKYTQRPGNPEIKITAMAGPNSVITYQIQAPGDLYAGAPQGDPGAVFCGVPPPPF